MFKPVCIACQGMDLVAVMTNDAVDELINGENKFITLTLDEAKAQDFAKYGTRSWASWNPYQAEFVNSHFADLEAFADVLMPGRYLKVRTFWTLFFNVSAAATERNDLATIR